MAKYCLLLIPLLMACGGSSGPSDSGTFEPMVVENIGPPHFVSAKILISNPSGAIVDSMHITFSGGAASLPSGNYNWQTIAVQSSPHDSSWWNISSPLRPITIRGGQITRDTFVICPMCM